jgi:hypothetical protein
MPHLTYVAVLATKAAVDQISGEIFMHFFFLVIAIWIIARAIELDRRDYESNRNYGVDHQWVARTKPCESSSPRDEIGYWGLVGREQQRLGRELTPAELAAIDA